jgi:hypothetical protein
VLDGSNIEGDLFNSLGVLFRLAVRAPLGSGSSEEVDTLLVCLIPNVLIDVFVGVESLSHRQVLANSYLAARPWIAMGLALIVEKLTGPIQALR